MIAIRDKEDPHQGREGRLRLREAGARARHHVDLVVVQVVEALRFMRSDVSMEIPGRLHVVIDDEISIEDQPCWRAGPRAPRPQHA
jgi:hypothetical protein